MAPAVVFHAKPVRQDPLQILARRDSAAVRQLLEFNESLRTILISTLFILGDIHLSQAGHDRMAGCFLRERARSRQADERRVVRAIIEAVAGTDVPAFAELERVPQADEQVRVVSFDPRLGDNAAVPVEAKPGVEM